MSFTTLGLSAPLLQAIADKGYETPSPIQSKAIPAILKGGDVMAAAQTGTGKTAGFTLPILELLKDGEPAGPNKARTLILTPTRELAAQVAQSVADYGRHLNLRSAVVFGGVKINPQMMALRKGVDVLIATPGRLLDLYQQNAVRFDKLEILVLDEADRMLDMGFINDIKKILALLPKQRQNLLFSATFSDDIRRLAKGIMNNAEEISVATANTTAENIEQWIVPVDKKRKADLLIELIVERRWQQVLVFTKTKHGANKLTRNLEGAGLKAAAIHGNKSQAARTKALAGFKKGDMQILVATDIAARGLDISQLPHVVNFDLPNVAEDYVHRIGRTARAGASGEAVSLVSADEAKQLAQVERLIQKNLPRKLIDGFEPDHDVPDSQSIRRPHRPKVQPRSQGNRGSQNSRGQNSGPGGNAAANKPRRRRRKPTASGNAG